MRRPLSECAARRHTRGQRSLAETAVLGTDLSAPLLGMPPRPRSSPAEVEGKRASGGAQRGCGASTWGGSHVWCLQDRFMPPGPPSSASSWTCARHNPALQWRQRATAAASRPSRAHSEQFISLAPFQEGSITRLEFCASTGRTPWAIRWALTRANHWLCDVEGPSAGAVRM
jgi:hypothetical protein